MDLILKYDKLLLDLIHNGLSCAFLDKVMPYITLLAEHGIVPIALSVALMLFPKTRKSGYKMALALIMGLIVVNLTVKPLAARVRPYDAFPGVELLIDAQSDYSFPSGHTLASFECAGVIYMCYKKYAPLAFAAACLVGLSRLYLYVHYPIDVLFGAILGLCFAVIACYVIDLVCSRRFPRRKA